MTKFILCIEWHLEVYHIEAEIKLPPFHNDMFKCIFFNENVRILNNISLKFVAEGQISNVLALAQTMAWHQSGNKP